MYTHYYSKADILIEATYDKLKMKEKKDDFREKIPFFLIQKNLCPAASLYTSSERSNDGFFSKGSHVVTTRP